MARSGPLSETGRVLTLALMIFGVGIVLYLITTFSQMVVEGKLRQILGRRNVEKHIRSLRDHFIICGYGRIGSQVARMLGDNGYKTVIVDNHPDIGRRLENSGQDFFYGSATEDDSLLKAGIERAKGLVATVSSDADNVFITLTAKGMNPDLFVIARATEPGSELKLRRAGADKVVSPYFIGARRIAQMVMRPHGGRLRRPDIPWYGRGPAHGGDEGRAQGGAGRREPDGLGHPPQARYHRSGGQKNQWRNDLQPSGPYGGRGRRHPGDHGPVQFHEPAQ